MLTAIRPLVFFCLLVSTIHAEPQKHSGLTIELLSEATSVQPGKTFSVGLLLRHDKHYHTYWKNPGIVGVATQLEWTLPDGWKAGEIQWPAPMLTKMADIPCYGYEMDTLLIVDVTPPKSISEKSITLRTKAAWMCCAKTCHPGFADLELTLPVSTENQTPPDAKTNQLFSESRSRLPKTSPDWLASAKPVDDKRVALTLTPRPGSDANTKIETAFFFDDAAFADSREPQPLRRSEDGSFTLTLTKSEFAVEGTKSLAGVLFSQDRWSTENQPSPQINIAITAPLAKRDPVPNSD